VADVNENLGGALPVGFPERDFFDFAKSLSGAKSKFFFWFFRIVRAMRNTLCGFPPFPVGLL
jgi:hypothetical protein